MTGTRGYKYNLVVMDIDFSKDGSFSICMKDYVLEAIDIFGKDIISSARNPAKGHLYDEDIEDHMNKLSEYKSETLHHIVAKLRYVSKGAHIDIDLAIPLTWFES